MKLYNETATTLIEKMNGGAVTSEAVMRAYLDRIASVETRVDAFLTLYSEEALLEKARAVDRRRAAGDKIGLLAGLPIAVKDNMCTTGVNTTCGSKMLEHFVPPYNATVVEKITAADGIIVGKTNMDEFAMGSSTENSGYKTTKNPWDLNRVPGGSSGGSAAAVAAGEVPLSLGSDTGGSIRQPAALTGLVGMKPTYGRISRYGLVAYASSLDQIGPFTKDVSDLALFMNVIAGSDERDGTSAPVEVPDYTASLGQEIAGLRVGLPRELFGEGIDAAVRDKVLEVADVLRSQGATVEEMALPYSKYALPVYYVLATSECSSNLARFDGVRYGYRPDHFEGFNDLFTRARSEAFGEEVKRRIMLGTYSLSAGYYDEYYNKGLKVRTKIKEDFDRAFESYDVLLSPTSPETAFAFGEKTDDPLKMYMSDICTVPVNIAGLPALSMNCGFVDGLPVGMQLIGKPFDEEGLIRVAHAYERATNASAHRAEL